MIKHPPKIQGFSLTELSVTLAIIGLLIAATLGGAHLLEVARLNGVISEMSDYQSAVGEFHAKYGSLPGDMPNAADFWTGCGGGTANVCNGDANGRIEYSAVDATDESFSAWEHLSRSFLIAGNYSGIGSGIADIGVNVPDAVIKGGGYSIRYNAVNFSTSNVLLLAAETASTNLSTGILSPSDAYAIDKKIDDGAFDAGLMRAAEGNGATGCVDEAATPDVYDYNNTAIDCIIGLLLPE